LLSAVQLLNDSLQWITSYRLVVGRPIGRSGTLLLNCRLKRIRDRSCKWPVFRFCRRGR